MFDRMAIDREAALSEPRAEGPRPPVFVLATGLEPTLAALRKAAIMRRETGARIVVLVPRVGSPRSGPSQDAAAEQAREYRDLATSAGVEATVCICVCRRIAEIFRLLVDKPSTVVIGTAGNWFRRASERRLAAAIEREGHAVFLADSPTRVGGGKGHVIMRVLKLPFLIGLVTI